MIQKLKLTLGAILLPLYFLSQNTEKKDTLTFKHYMPLYWDLPAEVLVKKGFKEFNMGGGFNDFKNFSEYRALAEYTFAPAKKLGVEIEVPFVFIDNKSHASVPVDTHEDVEAPEISHNPVSAAALRLGINYAFLSLPKAKTTFTIGYNNELETSSFKHFGKPLFEANIYNPFFVVAKVWGNRFHTMVYTGPAIKQEFATKEVFTTYRLNSTIAYQLGDLSKDTYLAMECNQSFSEHDVPTTILRPQVYFGINEKLRLGLVGSIPVNSSNEMRGGGFFRLVYVISQ